MLKRMRIVRGRFHLTLGRRVLAARPGRLGAGSVRSGKGGAVEGQRSSRAQEERAILWKILATGSELERACGDKAAADELREQARVIVEDIAAHAGELRDAFLAQPAVAELLGNT